MATGEIGELFVSGSGVARGYQDRPDLTDERFLTLPGEDGGIRAYRTGTWCGSVRTAFWCSSAAPTTR
ncbi:hypothetical protein [Streptomyces alanosinicus]|uniref:AMP-dependent synthetase/ligase domain-containing protein n=1 Tax=Streptomyces alanosinicus TaxID=68171 RepID=A0A918YRZ8_9ACTN|nr:hypothetical protein [Streptomyces alanosinicus]GHE14391.1 hypothetical protein GCM10010339_84810 [Streptomyces alanosinicus]